MVMMYGIRCKECGKESFEPTGGGACPYCGGNKFVELSVPDCDV